MHRLTRALQAQRIQTDVDLSNRIVRRVRVVVHQADLQGLILELSVVHLKTEPIRKQMLQYMELLNGQTSPIGIPGGIQTLAEDIRLVGHRGQFDLHEGVRGFAAFVHHGQVARRLNLHPHLARHPVALACRPFSPDTRL